MQCGFARIGTAGEHDGHAGAEHDAALAAPPDTPLFLGICRSGGHDQDVSLPPPRRPLMRAAAAAQRCRRRAGREHGAGDLTAVGHLANAAASSVAGMFGLIVSTAARMATRGCATPKAWARSTALRMMSALSCSVGAMLSAASVMMNGRG
jgi:hypothetical protein